MQKTVARIQGIDCINKQKQPNIYHKLTFTDDLDYYSNLNIYFQTLLFAFKPILHAIVLSERERVEGESGIEKSNRGL